MKLARRKSTQEIINDFQGNATSEGLVANAVKNGIVQTDVEIVDVTEAQYKVFEASINDPIRAAIANTDTADRQALLTKLNAIRIKLGMTVEEMKDLIRSIRNNLM